MKRTIDSCARLQRCFDHQLLVLSRESNDRMFHALLISSCLCFVGREDPVPALHVALRSIRQPTAVGVKGEKIDRHVLIVSR